MAQGEEQSCQHAGTGAIRGSSPMPPVGVACRFFSEVWKSKTLVPLPPGSLQTDGQISRHFKEELRNINLCGGQCFFPALPMVWEFLRDLEQLPLSKKLEVYPNLWQLSKSLLSFQLVAASSLLLTLACSRQWGKVKREGDEGGLQCSVWLQFLLGAPGMKKKHVA